MQALSFQLLMIDRDEQITNNTLHTYVLDYFTTRDISTSPIRISSYSLDSLLTKPSGKDILFPGSFFHPKFNVVSLILFHSIKSHTRYSSTFILMVLYLSMKSIGNWKCSTVLSKSERNNLPDYVERSYCISVSDLENQLRSVFFSSIVSRGCSIACRGCAIYSPWIYIVIINMSAYKTLITQ